MLKLFNSILKFLLLVLFLPVVIGVSDSFLKELSTIDQDITRIFFFGVASYLIVHVLVFQPKQIFAKGRRFSEIAFGFSQNFAKAASFALPIYSLGLVLIFFIAGLFWDLDYYWLIFLFLLGLLTTFHFVMAAEELKSNPDDFLKANYCFFLLIIWVLCIIILAGIFNLAQTGFYFNEFFDRAYQISSDMYIDFAIQVRKKLM